MARHSLDGARARLKVAQEAARIMNEQGIEDFRQAKNKAVERLQLRGKAALPTNREIEAALREHQALFGGDEHLDHIAALRTAALGVMHLLESFSPRLVGPVLAGTAAPNAAIHLHAFADNADDVGFFLLTNGLRWESFERRLKNRRDELCRWPGVAFDFKDDAFEVTVFPFDGLRQAPISPIDGKPMPRASANQVYELLDADNGPAN